MTGRVVSRLHRHYVNTPYGQLHVSECGTGVPVLFLHQTPRSWTEFIHVLPLVGREVRAIAIDTLGFGQSARSAEMSVERFADALLSAVDALDLDQATLVGHHTGAVIALEAAVQRPDRIPAVVLSALPLVTPQRRELMREAPPIDQVDPSPDGRHLTELWQRRRGFYRAGEEAALTRFVIDALQVFDRLEAGHAAVNDYEMERRLPLLRARRLLLCGADDPYALPDQHNLAERLDCALHVIEGAGVCLPEQRPAEFARAVMRFVRG